MLPVSWVSSYPWVTCDKTTAGAPQPLVQGHASVVNLRSEPCSIGPAEVLHPDRNGMDLLALSHFVSYVLLLSWEKPYLTLSGDFLPFVIRYAFVLHHVVSWCAVSLYFVRGQGHQPYSPSSSQPHDSGKAEHVFSVGSLCETIVVTWLQSRTTAATKNGVGWINLYPMAKSRFGCQW